MKTRVIYVGEGEHNCPADKLLADFRQALDENRYAKNIEFSRSCMDFFEQMADIYQETDDNVYVFYSEIPEQNLPPLEFKMRKEEGKYFLQYMKEYGDETTHIKGKARKGKNKNADEKIIIIKRESPENDDGSDLGK